MQNLLNKIEVALTYHTKPTVNQLDILNGDQILLDLIINNIENKYDYDELFTNIIKMLNDQINLIIADNNFTLNDEGEEHVIDNMIDQQIVSIINQIDNQFVCNNILSLALAPKKMLRSKMFLKQANNENYQQAALIELFHLATLIQDDVIDNGKFRRFRKTLSNQYNDQIALLMSDYLLVVIGYKIGVLARENHEKKQFDKDQRTQYISELIKDFLNSLLNSERQASKVKTIDDYEHYARNKTAKFFKLALICGQLVNEPQTEIGDLKKISTFGDSYGLLFQKVDDLIDYNSDVKTSGKDATDVQNKINNFILLQINDTTLKQIKNQLKNDANNLLESNYGITFQDEIKQLIRRIDE